jgi:hypothetical protein
MSELSPCGTYMTEVLTIEKLRQDLSQCKAAIETANNQAQEANRTVEDLAMLFKNCKKCGATLNFIGKGLYECWKCTAEELRIANAQMRQALEKYADKCLWVTYARDGELTYSIFVGNENGDETGVLSHGWLLAQKALGRKTSEHPEERKDE